MNATQSLIEVNDFHRPFSPDYNNGKILKIV